MNEKRKDRKDATFVDSGAGESTATNESLESLESSSANERSANLRREAVASALFFFALWAFWSLRQGDYLYLIQEHSLFLYRWDFLARWLDVPGGALFYATAFLEQFFYYPVLGGAILAGLGLAVQRATASFFGLRGRGVSNVLSFLPACFLTVYATWGGYLIFAPYCVELFCSGLLATLAILGYLAIFRRIRSPKARLAFGIGVGALAFPGVAFWSPFALALAALVEAGLPLDLGDSGAASDEADGTKRDLDAPKRAVVGRRIRVGALAASVVLAPSIWYLSGEYRRISFDDLFVRGLIPEEIYDKDPTTLFFMFVFSFANLVFFASALVGIALKRRFDETRNRRNRLERRAASKSDAAKTPTDRSDAAKQAADARKRASRLYWESAFVVCALAFAATRGSDNYFADLKCARAIENGDWERILDAESKLVAPSAQNVAFRNVALFETGQLGERAFERPIGGIRTTKFRRKDYDALVAGKPTAKFRFWLDKRLSATAEHSVWAGNKLMFCYLGLPNLAARNATDDLVACDGRSAACFKILAIAATINGEEALARRFLRELEQTLFYRDWARVRLAYLDSPEFLTGIRNVFDDAEYAKRRVEAVKAEAASVATSTSRAKSLDEAAARRGVEPAKVATVAERVAKSRRIGPVKDLVTPRAYPNLTFLLGVCDFNDYDVAEPEMRELILVASLMHKNTDAFLKNIEKYIASRPGQPLPRGIEEGYATWRFVKNIDDWEKCDYRFSPETVSNAKEFIEFSQMVENVSSAGSQEAIRDHCGRFYWGYAADDSTFCE